MIHLSTRGLMTALLAATSLGSAAFAQQQNAIALEEIVVTARRVEENLMTVPIAVTAFSSRDIESANMKMLGDIVKMTPSLNYTPQAGNSGRNERGASTLVFRGLFLSNQAAGLFGGGQLFIDGSPVVNAQPPSITDVERIEVLKGPQSVYFGRSTFLGAINFVTKDPGDEFKANVSAEASSFSSHDGRVSFEGPLIEDRLGIRVSGRHMHKGGTYVNATNPGGQKFQEQNTGSISGSLVFTPSDSLKIKAYANWFEDNDGPPAQGAFKQGSFTGRANSDGSCTPFSQLAPGVAAPGVAANSRASFGYICGTLPKVTPAVKRLISGDYDFSNIATRNALFAPNPNFLIFDPQFKQSGGLKRHAFQTHIRADFETESGYVLSSLSAYHRDKVSVVLDLNYRDSHDRPNPLFTPALAALRLPYLQFMQVTQNKVRDLSQEIRVVSPQDQAFRFAAGGSYFHGRTPGGTVYGNSANGPNFSAAITAQKVVTPAVFGAVYYDFNDALTLTAEARYQWDKLRQQPKIGVNGLPVVGVAATQLRGTYKSFSPRVSLDYKYADNSTIYALFSRGYRPGGFNAALITSTPQVIAALIAVVPNAGLTYLQEKLDNYEAGIKSTWLDGRARTTVTIYRDTWLNGQVANSIPISLPPATPGGPPLTNLIGLTVNNGKVALKGIELEGQFQATEELRLSANFGLNDSEIKSFGLGLGNCGDCNDAYGNFTGALGRRLPTTPKYTWSAVADYSDRLTDKLDWFARVDYAHRGSRFINFSAVNKIGAYDNVDARVGIRNDDFSFEAFVTNLTQNKVILSAATGVGVDLFTFPAGLGPFKNEVRFAPPEPRMIGVRTSYNF